MPDWLKRLLQDDGKPRTTVTIKGKSQVINNYSTGVVSVIAEIIEQDPSVSYAYTCHDSVLHISKLPKEGG